jgi:hypothetical protein
MRFQLHKSSPPIPAQNLALCHAKRVAVLHSRRREGGFIGSFWEVLLAVVIVAVTFGSIINGYLSTAMRAQWTAYSLAAQSLGLQAIEQTKSATWDISTGKNEITNLTLMGSSWNGTTKTYSGYTTNILDVPWKGTNYILATNFITIRTIYANNDSSVPVQVQIVRVDTVWPFTDWGGFKLCYYTNSVATFIAPDNRDPITLGVGGN